MRAPVLAALFLIATLALLAMPGSANFIGEFYILNGIFQEKIVFAFVAAIGIVLAAYYALRLFQHAMHNRKPDGIESREIGWREGAVVGGLVACIIAIALYPGLILHRADHSVSSQRRATEQPTSRFRRRWPSDELQRPPHRLLGALAGDRADRGMVRRADGRAAPAGRPLHAREPDHRGPGGHRRPAASSSGARTATWSPARCGSTPSASRRR